MGLLENRAMETWRANMYGIDFIPDMPEAPKEKSPVDKAIDEMMERRKAKRERIDPQPVDDGFNLERSKREKALDRAMSKTIFHHTTIAERLAAYRGPEL